MTDAAADALLSPVIVAVIALALLLFGRRRAALYALVALVLFAVGAVPHLLITPLLLSSSAPPGSAPAAIVVLASSLPGLLGTSPAAPDPETLTHLRSAAVLSRSTGQPILVSGARVQDGPVPIARQMAVSLRDDFGVGATWAENTSTNLWQSAAATTAILHDAGIGDVYLVAQPWEMRLSASVFRAAGLTVTPAPIPSVGQRRLDAYARTVTTTAWLDSALALRQWAGLACQALAPCVAWMRGPAAKPDPS